MPGLSTALIALVRRDMRLVVRHPSEAIHPVMFFVIVVALFPFGVGPDPLLLRTIGPGVIWVGALLATLLSLDALFRSDFDDGTLEQMALSGHPLTVLVLGKVFVHWCATGLPLLIVTPLLGLLLGTTAQVQLPLLAALALGTPTLSLIGAVGTALTVGIRRSGLLLTLLVLPLYVPVIIFGASVVLAAESGLPLLIVTPLLGLLLGMTAQIQLTLLAALALGTPTLSLVGAVGTALTLGIRRSGLLLTLLVLPLYVPVLIFGASVVLAAEAGLPTAGHFYILGAMMILALALAPLAASAALRISLN